MDIISSQQASQKWLKQRVISPLSCEFYTLMSSPVSLETPQHLIPHFPLRAEHGFLTGTKLRAWVLETWDQQVKMKPIVGVYLCATAQITSAPKPGFSDSLFIHESILSVTPAGEKIPSGQIRKSTSLQQSGALELQDVKVGGHHGRNLQVTHWHIFVILLHDDLKLCSTVVCLRAQQTYMLARPQDPGPASKFHYWLASFDAGPRSPGLKDSILFLSGIHTLRAEIQAKLMGCFQDLNELED